VPQPFDIAKTFIHLREGGGAEPVEVTSSFWEATAAGTLRGQLVGAFDFTSARDLHSTIEEMHPEADEVLVVISGALDVVMKVGDEERTACLQAGQAAVVPRGTWHRLVMRQPGRLLFINSRTAMQTRPHRSVAKGSRCSPT
jgi:mannose-6-phosphate isomerase-like protein (cupin superfamily)